MHNPIRNAESLQFKTCHELYLQNGDRCEPGQFIILKDPGHLGTTLVARVEEILQIKGSVADLTDMPDHILLQVADVSQFSQTYHMPRITLTNQWGLVSFKVCAILWHPCMRADCLS